MHIFRTRSLKSNSEWLLLIISSQQTPYVTNICANKSGRLISDLFDVKEKLNINSYLVTVDIEKSFDSLDNDFFVKHLI